MYIQQTSALALMVFVNAYTLAEAQICSTLLNSPRVSARQLYLATEREALLESDPTERNRPKSLRLSYIVPSHSYASGVVIVKTRHRIEGQPKNSDPTINLRRLEYKSSCRQAPAAAQKSEWSSDTEAERYINYHSKGWPDTTTEASRRLDHLHADLGHRPRRNLSEFNDRCAATSDWDIAPHFLFEDDLEARRVFSWTESISSRIGVASATTKSPSFAAPPAYTDYHKLATLVLPYQKRSSELSCISFSVPVPSKSLETHVVILDADDARWPRENVQITDPQRRWSLRWTHNPR
jgi:hypothetical protein